MLVFNECVHVPLCVSACVDTLSPAWGTTSSPCPQDVSNCAGLNRNAWPCPAEGFSGSPPGAGAPVSIPRTAL